MTLQTTELYGNQSHTNVTAAEVAYDGRNFIVDWLATWSYARENTERLVLYSVIAVCLGIVAVLLVVICYLLCCQKRRRSQRHRRIFRTSETTNGDQKHSSRNLLSSASTQTTSPENVSLLPPDSPDQTWVRSSPNRASPRPAAAADPSSSPSTLRSLPMRVHPGPSTVGDDLVWKTLERQRSMSPTGGLYSNPYRHDTFRTIDSRSSKSPRK